MSNRLASINATITANEAAEAQRQQEAAAQEQARQAAEAQLAQEQAQLEQQNNEQTVYVTPTGSKYHTHKCGNGTYTPATLDEALARGLTPCSKCYGG